MRLLIVEDDSTLRNLMRRALIEDGHIVDGLRDGRECAAYLSASPYDALLLDLNLPHMDGLALLRGLRSDGVNLPVLILTARDAVEDVIAGLDAGADDYLRKPFALGELAARLRSIGRRPPSSVSTMLCVGDLTYDTQTHAVRRGERTLYLTAKESAFLELLMRHPDQILTRRTLENRLWDHQRDYGSNLLDVYARRLRNKLSEAGESQLLQTVRGLGYRLTADQ
jgi:DNA-binding response OmpR family regulator